MDITNSNTNNVNGSTLSHIIMKSELSDINHSLNTPNIEENSAEDKNKLYLPLPYIERNSSNSALNQNLNLSNTLFEKKFGLLSDSNRKEELKKQKRNISNETLENGLNLDEQNLKEYYEKIENELNKLKSEKTNDSSSKIIKNEENKSLKIKNKFSINNNIIISQFDSDLFYYSDEEDNNKKNKEKKQIKTNLETDIFKNIKIEDKTEIKNDELIKSNNNSKKDYIMIDKDLLETIEYGIDETGNPVDIKKYLEEYYDNDNNNDNDKDDKKNKTKKLVAFIIQREEKGNNYLIDLKGNELPKSKDGYFNYKKDNIRLLIKDFDVQHPELRVFGARKRDDILLNDEDENIDKDVEVDIDVDIDNNKSIEIKPFVIPNNSKNKIINRNFSFNRSKTKNITFDKYCEQKRLVLKQNLINAKRSSPIMANNIIENNIKNNNKDNKQYHAWNIKEKPKTDDRKTFNYNRNKKDNFYRKILPKSFNETLSNNYLRNRINNDTIRRTNNILNRSESGVLYSNRYYKSNNNTLDNFNKLDLNIKNRNINNNIYLKSMTSNKSLYNDSKTDNNSSYHEIPNMTCTTSRINLYKNKKLNKRAGSFTCNYDKMFNLKSIVNKTSEVHQNNELLNYIEKKKQKNNENNVNNKAKDNNIVDKKNKSIENNENKNHKNRVIFNYEKKIVKKNNSVYIDSKINKNKNSEYIVSTIDNISKNIKHIQNNIQKNLIKLNNNKNETINSISNTTNNNDNKNTINIDKLKNNVYVSTSSTIKSQNNISREYPSYSNIFSSNNESAYNTCHTYNNTNNISSTNSSSIKTSVPKYHRNAMYSPPKNTFQCAILSKEVNDIIARYTNKNKENENMNFTKNEINRNDIYDYRNDIKNYENNRNSFLFSTKNKLQNSNYLNTITQRYNYITEPNSNNLTLNVLEDNNKQKYFRNKYANSSLCGYKTSKTVKKINTKEKHLILNNVFDNFSRGCDTGILQNQKNLDLNSYLQQNNYYNSNNNSSNNSYKLLNIFTEPKLLDYKIKMNSKSKSNSIASLNDINMNSLRNNEKYKNNIFKYSKISFHKNSIFNRNNNSYLLRNNFRNYTERSKFLNNNKIN